MWTYYWINTSHLKQQIEFEKLWSPVNWRCKFVITLFLSISHLYYFNLSIDVDNSKNLVIIMYHSIRFIPKWNKIKPKPKQNQAITQSPQKHINATQQNNNNNIELYVRVCFFVCVQAAYYSFFPIFSVRVFHSSCMSTSEHVLA